METTSITQSYFKYKKEADEFGALLLPVSKTHPPEKIKLLYEAGCRDFAENKVQELLAKKELLPADIRWHLIGHLQTNKVKYVVPFVALIHSLDSIKLLEEIDRQAAKVGRKVSCLLQVHIADEDTKFGFEPEEVVKILDEYPIETKKYVQIEGLMGMATLTDDIAKIESEFKSLKHLFDRLKSGRLPENVSMQQLSMGMSADFRMALQHGSTMIRIGSAIFGSR